MLCTFRKRFVATISFATSLIPMVFEGFKKLLHLLLGEYQYWKVYVIGLSPGEDVLLPPGVQVRQLHPEDLEPLPADTLHAPDYFGDGATGFGLFVNGELAALQGVWWGERYERKRHGRSWRIPATAAKTNNLFTIGKHRGKGYACLLKRSTHQRLAEMGFETVYCRIWHSHRNSIRVSRKAGMRLVGAYIEICLLRRRIILRIPLGGP